MASTFQIFLKRIVLMLMAQDDLLDQVNKSQMF